MRLKQIKLAGFKSFVDTTTISFQQQMTAIVGPNGCGKSNVIDAVRWVLGESSAKNLRGDAMTDVIFNGAATRKPVGQASVELVFENTQGRLQGSMADRSEVSIRRVVTRESISSYYLNGSKCRRRDITDIFLGTGLGPRSYAIIEQGTISRLIESKPQELRVFIEEAAGISKYKEKRRDSENRIRHTRENLERLTDVIVELTSQIDKLHQQAEAAKRFKTLKTNERKFKAELATMRWQQFEQKNQQSQQKMQTLQLSIEQLTVEQHQHELDIIKAKQQLSKDSEQLALYQQQKLQLSNDITRLEQNIKHLKQQALSDKKQKQQLQKNFANTIAFKQTLQQELMALTKELKQSLPELKLIEQQLEQIQLDLAEQQASLQQNFQHWQQANQQESKQQQVLADLSAQVSTQQVLIKQAEQAIKQLEQEQNKLTAEQGDDLKELSQQVKLKKQTLAQLNKQFDEQQNTIEALQEKQHQQQQAVVIAQTKQQALKASLTQLQQKDQQKPDWLTLQNAWLDQQNLTCCGQIYQQLSVNPLWQQSVELVFSHLLSAEVIELQPNFIALAQTTVLPEKLLLISTQNKTAIKAKPGTLAEQVSAEPALSSLLYEQYLNKIYLAENLAQAQQLLSTLAIDESVICADGCWLGKHFLYKGHIAAQDDCLARKVELVQLTQQLNDLDKQLFNDSQLLKSTQQALLLLNQQQQALNAQQQNVSTELQQNTQHLALAEQTQQHQQQHFVRNQQAIADHQQQLKQQTKLLSTLAQQHQQALQQHQHIDQHSLTALSAQREQLQQSTAVLQKSEQQYIAQRHQLSLTIEKSKAKKEHAEQKIQSSLEKQRQLEQNLQQLINYQQQQSKPLLDDEQQLQLWLTQMSTLEQKLLQCNQGLAEVQLYVEQHATMQAKLLANIEQLKAQVNQHHLDSENARLRAETMIEQLNDMGQNLTEVLANMPSEAKESHWQVQIHRLAKDIEQLGAINLAAIDEYNRELQRKNFLDQQHQDLTLAITTLESAIAKIDKQSRQKFKTTFEQVNNDLKRLFPRVFGGGSAYLALTGDDLLETGVTIMARPPGKKNSTIHLLSGGEKALTALSLVFAIFRLNPAPFCMLDEVDAPLDDANVLRFCNLVEEMSNTVQFIYISHNKIAMEMAAHLTGVTMFEPGVSRMVAVDIDEAVAMAQMA
jgi:chromosome segregation protein